MINHYISSSSKNHGLTLDSSISIENMVESSWMIFIHSPIINEDKDSHVIEQLDDEYITKKDHCILLKSSMIDHMISLRIYCNTTDRERETITAAMKTVIPHPLNNTIHHLQHEYGKKSVLIEQNMANNHHSFHWSGGYEHVDQILKAQKRKKNRQQHHRYDDVFSPYDNLILPNDRSSRLWRKNDVQSSPTWGLDRIDQRFGLLNNQYTYLNQASSIDIYIIGNFNSNPNPTLNLTL